MMGLIFRIFNSLLLLGVFFILGFSFKKHGYAFLRKLTKKSKWRADDVLIESLKTIFFSG